MADMKKDKWSTLKHNGPLFPKPYVYRNLTVQVKGKSVPLSLEQEEMAWAWGAKLETPYVEDKVFQKNFWSDFKPLFSKELQETKFPEDWDFRKIHTTVMAEREKNKEKPKEVKEAEKAERDKLKAIYGRAELDGHDVELGAYIVEPAGLFMGRGQHPLRGKWKTQAQPEDITLNLSKGSPVPPAPTGHKWGEVVENKGALWTAMWRDSIGGAQKRIMFGATSFVKQNADQKKFQKAIDLANNWDKVIAYIDKGLTARDLYTRKVATICKIISVMSIRVGDEKEWESADTVGATSLRIEHIKVLDTKIEFDFLGKDSVRYHNIVEFDVNVIRNIKEFINGKKKGDKIFDELGSPDVSMFLSGVQPGLTAKQFRTATGSTLLCQALVSKELDPNLKEAKKLEHFTNANLEVALKLNHQSAVSAGYDVSVSRMKEVLAQTKKEYNELKASIDGDLDAAKAERDKKIELAKLMKDSDRSKKSIKRAKEAYKAKEEGLTKKLSRMKDRVELLQSRIAMKEKTRGVALGTSKLNYSDPRIPISWCKANNVDVKRIYPVTAQKKFSWALDVDEDFYKKYPKV